MADCYIRAVKVQGNVVSLALCRFQETRDSDYSQNWGDRIRMICLYPPDTEPEKIRRAARRDYGYAYYDEDTKWADPVLVPMADWKPHTGKPNCEPLKNATEYWPN